MIPCTLINHIYSVINIKFIEWSGIARIARKELKRALPVIPVRIRRQTGPAQHATFVIRKAIQ